MDICKCNKDAEIAEIHTNVKHLVKLIEGNGMRGLIEQVRINTKYRLVQTGGIVLLTSLIGYGVIKFV